jgi:hypothetical protein
MLSGDFPSFARWNRSRVSTGGLAALLLVAALGAAQCESGHAASATPSDAPLIVPWSRIGDIWLGEARARVVREYGPQPRLGYRLHRGTVQVSFDRGRVRAIYFSTPYYRTKSGIGVGSSLPLGPCHRTAQSRCRHLWHGFVWNAWSKEKPCSCWTKVGLGRRSLPATVDNYLKPWFIISVRRGRVTAFYFDLKYVD